ncbi:MAG: peptide ABC transporter substrate-binding protein [Alphaproteobacteria bacterium]|nr:peptide ABC transporter substrate-binding protein [Alphaproteobacteria bacterium]
MRRRRPILASLCLLLALALVRPGPAAAAKDELVIGITQFPSTLHPNIDSMMAKSYVLGMTRRPFTAYDRKWQLVCMLCVTLPTIENGLARPVDLPDGRRGVEVTYTIQPGARWGDGVPVTTKDVVFTWEIGRHPMSGVTSAEGYRRITRIDVKDERTFTVHVDRLTYEFAASGSFQLVPEHLEREAFADPAQYRFRTKFDTDPTNPGLHFGPYRIVEVASGSHIVLERNSTWYGPPPAFRRIVVRAIENTAALEANLLSGAIDYIAGELGLSLEQAMAFETRHRDRFAVAYKPGLVYEHIDLNLDNPILKDRRVREALLLAIDREKLTQSLFGGRQPVARGAIHPLDWIHADDLPAYAYDARRAAALLDEAGWTRQGGGTRLNAAGEKLTFELMTTAGNRTRELVQQVLQSQWRQVGIEVRLRNEPPRVFFGETVTKRRFPAMAMFAWLSAPESVPRTTLHSQSIPRADNNFSGQNSTGYANPEMDRLIEAIEVELDRDRRRALWHALQHLYAQDLPVLPLFFRSDSFILPRWLSGIEPTGHQYPTTLWVENWRDARP